MNARPQTRSQVPEKRYPNADERAVHARLQKDLRRATIYCAITAPFFLATAIPLGLCVLLPILSRNDPNGLGVLLGAVVCLIVGAFFGILTIVTGAVFGTGVMRYFDTRQKIRNWQKYFYAHF